MEVHQGPKGRRDYIRFKIYKIGIRLESGLYCTLLFFILCVNSLSFSLCNRYAAQKRSQQARCRKELGDNKKQMQISPSPK